MQNFEVKVFPDADELSRSAAANWLDEIGACQREGRKHCVALSGGRIARRFFASAVDQAKIRGTAFDGVHLFWADERCVPPADPESNYRIARELLLEPLGIADFQIHRVRGEDPPEAAAGEAQTEMCKVAFVNPEGQPVLDLILLGMGEDGHVASLFPGEPQDRGSSKAIYRPVMGSPKPPANRITLGYPTLTAAREVWVLVSGPGKESALRASLKSSGSTPLGRVLKLRRRTTIYTDIAA